MGSVKVAIVGVGNCASSLVQGVHYYRDADETTSVPGLMHVQFGPYHVRDVEFVAAFDVDAKKVGFDLSEAITASENNTIKIADVPPLGVTVQRGPTYDGLGKYYRETIARPAPTRWTLSACRRSARPTSWAATSWAHGTCRSGTPTTCSGSTTASGPTSAWKGAPSATCR